MHRFLKRACGEQRDAFIEAQLDYVEETIAVTDAQRPAWNDLATAARAVGEIVEPTCKTMAEGGAQFSKPARAARMELMLSTALKVVQSMRTPLKRFYEQLEPPQRVAFDQLRMRRH